MLSIPPKLRERVVHDKGEQKKIKKEKNILEYRTHEETGALRANHQLTRRTCCSE